MRVLATIVLTAALAGCTAWTNGSWLDAVGRRPSPPAEMSDAQAQAVTSEVARLRADAQTVRSRMTVEPDRNRRLDMLGELRRIDDASRPLEEQLRRAGRPVPYDTAAVPRV